VVKNKLDFWIKHHWNVLFKGKHGVGKTSLVTEAFNRANLCWRYFSAATMDPWVDFIGVPKSVTDDFGNEVLELIRPKDFADDRVEAIFFDEFNRCLTGDTRIPLADGFAVPIKDLVGQNGFYVYSYDLKNHRIVIAKGHTARKTGTKQRILTIVIDNGTKVQCTPDHPFLYKKRKVCSGIPIANWRTLNASLSTSVP